MHTAALKIDTRRKKILDRLVKDSSVSAAALSRELGVSVVTIRNDLDALERSSCLTRVQGGAVLKKSSARPLVSCETEKLLIADAVSRIVKDGDTLFLNSGTTTEKIAEALLSHKSLNIVTSSIVVATTLSAVSSFRVILLGGEINPQYGFTKGGDAQEQLRKYQADYAILSVDGVSMMGGITTYHADEAIIAQMMAEQASQLIIAADHTKIGHAGFSMICPAKKVSTLVTDPGAPQNSLEEIAAGGISVVILPTGNAPRRMRPAKLP